MALLLKKNVIINAEIKKANVSNIQVLQVVHWRSKLNG